MGLFTLTVVDTSGIQDYVFGTNQLKQIIGASYLVECATRLWLKDLLAGTRHNLLDLDDPARALSDEKIEAGRLEAELVYAGGGNAVLIFANRAGAVEFTRRLSRRLLLQAPGLRVAVAHRDFDWESQALGGAGGVVLGVMQDLAVRKAAPPLPQALPGLGVTAACGFTGLPAVGIDSDGRPISAEVKAKLAVAPQAQARLVKLLDWGEYNDPPQDFDELGATHGEKSLLAVIHTDGNGIGKRVEAIGQKYSSPQQNREYIEAMRRLSFSIQAAARTALQATVDLLKASVESDGDARTIGDQIVLAGQKLPFRPIVFGGDDVTFVCDGRIGLSLAAYYLQALTSQTLDDSDRNQPAYCRAGIAVVHSHYPFARAYALAEDLCGSAKGFIGEHAPGHLSALDWHFAVNGLVLDLKEIRRREYVAPAGKLLMRPLALTETGGEWRTWANFERAITGFQSGSDWAGRHNKVKALIGALPKGLASVQNFCRNYATHLPVLDGQSEMANSGWHQTVDGVTGEVEWRCGYFDAVEAVDMFIPLKAGVAA